MDLVTVLSLAFGLAMDAFAVAIISGIVIKDLTYRHLFRLSFHFGLFQFLMPIIGWFLGRELKGTVEAWDHWITLVLLGSIGGKMVYEALTGEEGAEGAEDPTKGAKMVGLSVATSIDALAIGLTLGVLNVDIWYPAVIIGLVAAGMTLAGMFFGRRLGVRFGKKMEVIGGVVLILLGLKIFISHVAGFTGIGVF